MYDAREKASYAYTAFGEPTICNSSGTVIWSSSISNRYALGVTKLFAINGLISVRRLVLSKRKVCSRTLSID